MKERTRWSTRSEGRRKERIKKPGRKEERGRKEEK
jgi:hypothetical protein